MTKAVKKKVPVKKKSARKKEIADLLDPNAQRKLTRAAEAHLKELEANADERYEWALALKKQQSDDMTVVINRLVAQMAKMAGRPNFIFQGINWNVPESRLLGIQVKNHTWIAMRLLVASAEWGIRIGNFKSSKDSCIRCGKSVKPKKKGK